MESEYVACSAAVQEAVWLRSFIQALGVTTHIDEAVAVHCENTAAQDFVKDPKYHGKAKHIGLGCLVEALEVTAHIDEAVAVHYENTAALDFVKDPKYHEKAKHIGFRYHFIRTVVAQGEGEIKNKVLHYLSAMTNLCRRSSVDVIEEEDVEKLIQNWSPPKVSSCDIYKKRGLFERKMDYEIKTIEKTVLVQVPLADPPLDVLTLNVKTVGFQGDIAVSYKVHYKVYVSFCKQAGGFRMQYSRAKNSRSVGQTTFVETNLLSNGIAARRTISWDSIEKDGQSEVMIKAMNKRETALNHRRRYKLLHMGLVQVAIKPLTRNGLNNSVLVCLRDCRHSKFKNPLLAIDESSLNNGLIYFNCYPSYPVSLECPYTREVLTLNIKTQGFQGDIAVLYRIYYKVSGIFDARAKRSSLVNKTTFVETNLLSEIVVVPRTAIKALLKRRRHRSIAPGVVRCRPKAVERLVRP
ncbi:LOW QUALITY PROTEIN: hypothetical protein RJ640_014516 [Escallonia rubra]|uniref:Uncharacterized protein n=1 Tax=Escallonia rubra TaxID=112253 RepID=A0AA88RJ51_9ASTE|nr:LOW QUALITY PROTEIN: hypothetical protein RJ640_014516 [Escallonia rubra]